VFAIVLFTVQVHQLRDTLDKKVAALKKVAREKADAEAEADHWRQVQMMCAVIVMG
jgi:hypothetical protein